jgi:ABC-type transport system substrate-binding protein
MAGEPPGLSTHINPAGTATPGLPELTEMIAPGLSSVDSNGQRVPVLAAELPSTERGSWLVEADGRMQTTWKLRPNVTWHDGRPFTTEDLVFTVTAGRDPELSEFGQRRVRLDRAGRGARSADDHGVLEEAIHRRGRDVLARAGQRSRLRRAHAKAHPGSAL